jgi:hypothetical protein
MSAAVPDLALIDDNVPAPVAAAMRAASAQLRSLGVRHLLVGGLAVTAWGHQRNTRDVDFFVGDEAFEHHGGGLVTMKPGMPIQIQRVVIDHLSAQDDAELFQAALDNSLSAPGVPLAPLELLVYLKLKSPRGRDRVDLEELVRTGIDTRHCRRWLEEKAPQFLNRWDEIVKAADE